jgi:integrase
MSKEITVHTEQQELRESKKITWAEVFEAFFKHLDKEGKQDQKRNFKTAFKQFLEAIGVEEKSLVGTELEEEFEAKLKVFVEFEVSRKIIKSTYDPRVSKIKALKKFVDKNFAPKLQLQNLPKTFGQRLLKLIGALGLTVMSFWRGLPNGLVSYSTFNYWCTEKYLPSARSFQVMATIESYLHVPSGTLRPPKYCLLGRDLKIGVSDSGNKTQAAKSKPYYVWTNSLEREFQGLFSNKTLAILPEGEERSENGQWTSSDGAEIPTAVMVRNILKSFLGFCALPVNNSDPYLSGAGIEMEDLSMALLADKRLVESFLAFKKLRSGLRVRRLEDTEVVPSLPDYMICADGRSVYYDKGGKYNRGTLLFLTNILSLLRPKKGYLYQHPEFAQKLGSRMTAANWHQQCREARSRADRLHKTILQMKKQNDERHFDFGRDPKEIIQWILDLSRPLKVLQQLLKDMLDDLLPEFAPDIERARQFRDIVLVGLLSSNPLRVHMFSIMKFGKNLFRDSDGSWWLKFNKGAFKNRKSLKCNYEVRIATELWPLLDRYYTEFHPILIGPTNSDFVFVGSGRGRHPKQNGKPLNENCLSSIIRNVTELYIPDAIGFRPHAFRHIIATDLIKKDPGFGFYLASRALHDKLETVEEEYIHLKTSEFFEPVNTHFSETWEQVFGASHVGKEVGYGTELVHS